MADNASDGARYEISTHQQEWDFRQGAAPAEEQHVVVISRVGYVTKG